jgi:hypothetical protein
MQKLVITTTVFAALAATAALADPMGPQIHFAEIHKEDLPPPSSVFSAEEGEGITRSARVDAGRKARQEAETNTEYCFHEMREAADAGECSIAFFAEDASCDTESHPGCFENRFFRRKLDRLGFKVRKQEIPTADQDDHCAAITVQWCRDLRKARR